MLFRDHLTKKGFCEIHTPRSSQQSQRGRGQCVKVTQGLRLPGPSPRSSTSRWLSQLTLTRFSVGGVFRAEDSNTTGIHEVCLTSISRWRSSTNYHEVVDLPSGHVTLYISGAEGQFAKIATVGQQFPAEPFKFRSSLRAGVSRGCGEC